MGLIHVSLSESNANTPDGVTETKAGGGGASGHAGKGMWVKGVSLFWHQDILGVFVKQLRKATLILCPSASNSSTLTADEFS